MKTSHLISVLLVSTSLLNGSGFAQNSDADAIAREKALQTLSQFKQQLQGALRSGLNAGPAEAIAACQVQAPAIAGSLSVDGIRIGRASHRLRNPANVAPGWVEPVLAAYLDNPDDREPKTVAVSASMAGYAEPIIIQPLCTTCHGEAIDDALQARIDLLYPEDRAVGFREGDLRGVFWIEYPTE